MKFGLRLILRLTLGLLLSLAAILVLLDAKALAAGAIEGQVTVEVSRVAESTHIEFSGITNWKYDLKRQHAKDGDVIVLRLPPMKAGAVAKLKAYDDTLIESVDVNPKGVDDNFEVSFHLNDVKTDFFEYLTDQPQKLVLDIFQKVQKVEKKAEAAPLPEPTSKAAEKQTQKTGDESPALANEDDSDAISDGMGEGKKPAQAGASPSTNPENKPKNKLAKALPRKKENGAAESERKESDPKKVSQSFKSEDDSVGFEKVGSTGFGKRKPASDHITVGNDPMLPDFEALSQMIGKNKDFKHGIFDGGDPKFRRFDIQDYEVNEAALIASKANLFIHFPMLKLGLPALKKMDLNSPLYEIIPMDPTNASSESALKENKEAMLLVTLFKRARYGVFLTTAKEFLEHYKNTKYDEIVRYMMADAHLAMWRTENQLEDFDEAMSSYRALTEKYPESPLRNRTLLYVGYAYLARGDSINALKALQHFAHELPNSSSIDQVRIYEGEAAINLNRFDDAYKTFDQVEKSAANKKDAVEAAYRKGDVFFERKDLAEAVKQYKEAIRKYPEASNEYPNAYYNMAEAQFWNGEYRDSLNSYRSYLIRFPDHEHGGYAMTRLGELLEILGADKKRVVGAYLESFFRYRNTPGASVARIRLLTDRFGEMKEKELKNSLKEIEDIRTQAKLSDLEEFIRFMECDGYFKKGDFQKATDILVSYYQANPTAANRDKFQSRVVRNITEEMRRNIEQNKFIEALRIYGHYSTSWLKNNERIDTRFYIGRAYELAGVYNEAGDVYRETLNKLYSIKGTSLEKERNVFEVLPHPDQLNLRLAVVASSEKEFSKAYTLLKEIKNNDHLSEDEQVERAGVSVDVFEARSQLDAAKKYLGELVDTWKGQPVAVSGLYLRLAKLDYDTKSYKDGEIALKKIMNMQNDTGLVPEDVHAKGLELAAQLQVASGKKTDAVETYRQLLDTYEAKRPLASVRYKMGMLQFQAGDMKSAQATWTGLKDDKTGVWYRLAMEQMQGAQWRGEYKKYLDRIPAMAGMKRE